MYEKKNKFLYQKENKKKENGRDFRENWWDGFSIMQKKKSTNVMVKSNLLRYKVEFKTDEDNNIDKVF